MPTIRLQSVSRPYAGLLLTAALAAPGAARAVDGCLVLLCFAAPSWRAIPECVPPITQVLRDLAMGRPFPICAMSGSGNAAANQWAVAPDFCPPQYTHLADNETTPIYTCDYVGAVSVQIEGRGWTRTWWNLSGDSVTEYTPVAKRLLGTWDPRFDNDYAAWQAVQPPPTPCEGC